MPSSMIRPEGLKRDIRIEEGEKSRENPQTAMSRTHRLQTFELRLH